MFLSDVPHTAVANRAEGLETEAPITANAQERMPTRSRFLAQISHERRLGMIGTRRQILHTFMDDGREPGVLPWESALKKEGVHENMGYVAADDGGLQICDRRQVILAWLPHVCLEPLDDTSHDVVARAIADLTGIQLTPEDTREGAVAVGMNPTTGKWQIS